jgi:sugar/nucleoside kinase (ribokinase family)
VAAVDSPAFVIFEGFLADRDHLVEAVLSYADEAGATLVVDLGHPGVAAAAARVADAAGGPVIVFGTEAEVAAVVPEEESPAGAPESGVSYLREAASVLVVKRGTRGATVYRGASTQADCPAQRAAHARTELSVVDTTGAGDVFAGAFLEGQLRGLSDEEACRIASFAARLSLGDYGGRLSRVGIERLEAVFGDAGAISSR